MRSQVHIFLLDKAGAMAIRLLDKGTSNLYAQCHIPVGVSYLSYIEKTTDSSRCFVLKVCPLPAGTAVWDRAPRENR